MKYKLFLVSIILILFKGCNNPEPDIKTKAIEKISFHNNIKIMQDYKAKNKVGSIIAYFDAGCSKCVTKLEKYKEFREKNKNNGKNIELIIVLHSLNIGYVKYAIHKFNYNECKIFYDKEKKFTENNEIFNKCNTVLTDTNMNVIMGGYPFYNKKHEKLYEKKITKLSTIVKE